MMGRAVVLLAMVAAVLACEAGPARGEDKALLAALDALWDPDEPLPGSVRFSVPPEWDGGEPHRYAFVRRGGWDMATVYFGGGGWSSVGDDGPPYCLRLDWRTVVTVPGWTSYEADDNGVVWCSGADCPAAAAPYRGDRTPIPPEVARAALAGSGACDDACTWHYPGAMRTTMGPIEDRRMRAWSVSVEFAEEDSRADRRLWLLCGGPEPAARPEPPRPLTPDEILERQEAALLRLEAAAAAAEGP